MVKMVKQTGRNGKMVKPAWPEIDTKVINGKTDKCAEHGKIGKWEIGKMAKPAGRGRKW